MVERGEKKPFSDQDLPSVIYQDLSSVKWFTKSY